MRKLISLASVFVLLVVFAVPAGAKTVSYESLEWYDVQAWQDWEDADAWVHLNVNSGENPDGSRWFGIVEYRVNWSGCVGDIDWFEIEGYGEPHTFVVEPLKGKDRYMTGYVEGFFEEGRLTWADCSGLETTVHFQDLVDDDFWKRGFRIELEGVGDLVKLTWTEKTNNPGDGVTRTTQKFTMREAFGMVDISHPGPWEVWTDGGIGKSTLTRHINEK